MEGHCSTGQNPQRAVVPMEEERKEEFRTDCGYISKIFYPPIIKCFYR